MTSSGLIAPSAYPRARDQRRPHARAGRTSRLDRRPRLALPGQATGQDAGAGLPAGGPNGACSDAGLQRGARAERALSLCLVQQRRRTAAEVRRWYSDGVTREESWKVEGVTLTLLRHIASLGYVASVHRIPSSLLGSIGAFVEMHAIDDRVEPPMQHLVRVGVDEGGDTDYRCACLLAEAVGIDLRDG